MDGALRKSSRPHDPVASLRPRGAGSPFSVPGCLCFFTNGGLTWLLGTPSIKLGTLFPGGPRSPGLRRSQAGRAQWLTRGQGSRPGCPGSPQSPVALGSPSALTCTEHGRLLHASPKHRIPAETRVRVQPLPHTGTRHGPEARQGEPASTAAPPRPGLRGTKVRIPGARSHTGRPHVLLTTQEARLRPHRADSTLGPSGKARGDQWRPGWGEGRTAERLGACGALRGLTVMLRGPSAHILPCGTAPHTEGSFVVGKYFYIIKNDPDPSD